MKKILLILSFMIFSMYIMYISASASSIELSSDNVHQSQLYTPTYITKIDNVYFIVDCWNNRVIYSDELTTTLNKWNVLTSDVKGPHSIASDEKIYVIDDTDSNTIKSYKKIQSENFELIQEIKIEGRPHFVKYDKTSAKFYVLSSIETKIYIFRNNNDKLVLENEYYLAELKNSYTRSFNIIDNKLYTVSVSGFINVYDIGTFKHLNQYEVSQNITALNFIEKINDQYYLTSYSNAYGEPKPNFIRVKNLEFLKDDEYESLYQKFGFEGVPYYISLIDDRYYITEIDTVSGIKSFKDSDVKTHWKFTKTEK